MWQAVVASWLMVMTSGQLELNAPQNARIRPKDRQPAWKPAADDPADQSPPANTRPAIEKIPSATNLRPAINDYQPPANNPARPAAQHRDRLDRRPSPALPKPIITRQTYFSLPARRNGRKRGKIAKTPNRRSADVRFARSREQMELLHPREAEPRADSLPHGQRRRILVRHPHARSPGQVPSRKPFPTRP